MAEIAAGSLDKLVLAREVTVHAEPALFRQARPRRTAPGASPVLYHLRHRRLHRCDPELLVARRGGRSPRFLLRAPRPAAATRTPIARPRRRCSPRPRSAAEHRVVVDAITSALAPVVERLELPEGPVIRELRNVSHLGTSITGALASRDRRYPSALELVGLLHPTPAVAGTPVDLALDYLAKLEELDRDRYAGRSAGSTPAGTASGTSASAPPSSREAMPGCSQAWGSCPTPIPRQSWPRPSSSFRRSSRPRCVPDPGHERRIAAHDLGDLPGLVEGEKMAAVEDDQLGSRHLHGQ